MQSFSIQSLYPWTKLTRRNERHLIIKLCTCIITLKRKSIKLTQRPWFLNTRLPTSTGSRLCKTRISTGLCSIGVIEKAVSTCVHKSLLLYFIRTYTSAPLPLYAPMFQMAALCVLYSLLEALSKTSVYKISYKWCRITLSLLKLFS